MKIMTVVGARPNFMKAAPIIAAIRAHGEHRKTASGRATGPETIQHILVHTGQHYGQAMSDSFFADLGLPVPDVHLGVGSATHAVQVGEIMRLFEPVLLNEKPDVLIVVGDVNSTLACALVTSKISFGDSGKRPVIAHVEAGLRSFDRAMPEEINRILTDQLADLLFVTEESGLRNLQNEGLPADRIHFAGNTMIDSLLAFKEKAEASTILERLKLRTQNGDGMLTTPYALLTLHRPANVDNRDAFLNILAGLDDLATDYPIVFPVHPRTQQRIREFSLKFRVGGYGERFGMGSNGMILIDPLGYLDFVCLMKHASIVVTDSGGIQEETTCLGVPCVTVRDNTERPVTIESGTNILGGTRKETIREAIRRQIHKKRGTFAPKNWDGRAAVRILDVLMRTHYGKTSTEERLAGQFCA
jgi:UDP-N-acetylglucosamine 2-epimerase (non-hydrolysing)